MTIAADAFVAGQFAAGPLAAVRGAVAASPQRDVGRRSLYPPILRRDPGIDKNMRIWIKWQNKARLRQMGVSEQKWKEAEVSPQVKPWHLVHTKVGDRYKGYMQHPDLQGDRKIPVVIEVIQPPTTEDQYGEVRVISTKVGLNDPGTLIQDFAIEHTPGPKRTMDMATFCFMKASTKWLDFDNSTMPAPHELQRLKLDELRKFFERVTKVTDFPTDEEYKEACADPEQGMTKDEFIDWLESQEPGYVAKMYETVRTSRRMQIQTEDLFFDGEFSLFPGLMLGYVNVDNKPGGKFEVELQKDAAESMV